MAKSHVGSLTGHHPPPLVQGRFLGVVSDAAGYAHIFCPPLLALAIAAAGMGFVIGALANSEIAESA